MSLSFSNANRTSGFSTLDTNSLTDTAYDPNLKFNSVVHRRDNSPKDTIFSIDPKAFLNRLATDNLNDLLKITLAATYTQNGVGMWDVLFNTIERSHLTACVFTAGPEFFPMNSTKTKYTSQYLDPSKPISRSVFGAIKPGDCLGVGIYDVQTRKTYAVLYNIVQSCMGQYKKRHPKDQDLVVPAVNCDLVQIYRVEANGEADVINASEDVVESIAQQPFVMHLIESVRDIRNAYPWKPHFEPAQLVQIDRVHVEKRILEEMELASVLTYDAFEEICQITYNKARDISIGLRESQRNLPRNERKQVGVPVVEVVSLGGGEYIGRLADHDGYLVGTYRFSIPECHTAFLVERSLTNKDIAGLDLVDAPGIVILSKSDFGENATLRYLSLSF